MWSVPEDHQVTTAVTRLNSLIQMTESLILGAMGVSMIEKTAFFRVPDISVRIPALVLIAMLAIQFEATAADAAEANLFTSDEVLELTIRAPLKTIGRDQEGEPEYHPATLLFSNDTGDIESVDIRLRIRGNYRRQSRICRAPPLFLDLPKKSLTGTVFEGQDKIKLVSHCQKPKRYQQFLLKEYLAYRVLNILTDVSHRVHRQGRQTINSLRVFYRAQGEPCTQAWTWFGQGEPGGQEVTG
jgi:hypothetical protein